MPEAFCALQTGRGAAVRSQQGYGRRRVHPPSRGTATTGMPRSIRGRWSSATGSTTTATARSTRGCRRSTTSGTPTATATAIRTVRVQSCSRPAGYVTNNTDCNDGDRNCIRTRPGTEMRTTTASRTGRPMTSCTRPAGYRAASELLATSGDCNDGDANVHIARTWFRDADGDGYGDPAVLRSRPARSPRAMSRTTPTATMAMPGSIRVRRSSATASTTTATARSTRAPRPSGTGMRTAMATETGRSRPRPAASRPAT